MKRILILACVVVLAFVLAFYFNSKTTEIVYSSHDDVTNFLAKEHKKMISFIGYSDAGYEDQDAMLEAAKNVLLSLDNSKYVINIGMTQAGIGAIYPLAKELGFTTTGIVSSLAVESGAELSNAVDKHFYIKDTYWGGVDPLTGKLVPTSAIMVINSDRIVAIGGGEIALEEVQAARGLQKPVTFIAADMEHSTAIEKAQESGEKLPTKFNGVLGQWMAKHPD